MSEITWTNCAVKMPPDDDDHSMVIVRFNGVIKRQSLWLFRICSRWCPELYEWTPYTDEKWEELNK